jgi:hypothetical protein
MVKWLVPSSILCGNLVSKKGFARYGCTAIGLVSLVLSMAVGCQSFGHRPLKDRVISNPNGNWTPEQAVVPRAEIQGTQYKLHNIRDCQYLTEKDFVLSHHDRLIDLSQIQSVDFIVVPFKPNSPIAHTMVSFGLDDGSYLCVSVETRRQIGDSYQALASLTRGYDLMYVLGEERDLIGVRTNQFDVEVYIYPTTVAPETAQEFFVDVIERMNELQEDPEYYHLLANNCTTNLKDHVNNISPNRINKNSWAIWFTGFSARYAHRIGLIENRIPYEELKRICYINDLAKDHLDHPQFSQYIRSRRYQIDREIARQQQRQPLLEGRGHAMLNQRQPKRQWR